MPELYQRGVDSIAEFELAARQRLSEGQRLYARSHYLGAIYLFGYAIEMRMKALYFRAAGFAPDRVITQADRSTAVSMYSTLGLPTQPGPHDIAGWAALAVAARATTTHPFPVGLGLEIVDRATEVYLLWRETLRYWATTPYAFEYRKMRTIAEWFEANYAIMI